MDICRVYIKKFSYGGAVKGERKKAESANGTALLRIAVGDSFDLDSNTLKVSRSEHGKPYFPERNDIQFNISHSGELAAAAVSDREVGVDIQKIRPIKENIISKLCDERELEYINNSQDRSRAFVHLWALKESYIKMIGRGMSFPMSKINFDLTDFDGRVKTGAFSNREGYYYIEDIGDYALAVCSADNRIFEINKVIGT